MLPLEKMAALALIQPLAHVGSSASGPTSGLQQMRQKYLELLRSVIAPCSAIAAEPFFTTLFFTTEDSRD